MNNKRITKTLVLLLLVIFLAPSAYGIQVSVQSNGAGYSEYIQATKDQFLKASTSISETGISHTITGTANLAESHFVSDRARDYAGVGAQIIGASRNNPYTYSYELYPGEGAGKGSDNVWAMEALNVPSASYINAYSLAINRAGYTSGASTTVSGTGSSLMGYSNLAFASANLAGAAQGFDSSSGSQIQTNTWSDTPQLQLKPLGLKIDDVSSGITAKSGSITGYKNLATATTGKLDASEHMDSASGSQIQTQSKYLSASASLVGGWKSTTVDSVTTAVTGTLSGYNADSQKSGDVSGTQQTGHVAGTFTSTATAGTGTDKKSTTRASDFGRDYDLNMQAHKDLSGSTVSGTLGYYVNSNIQGAVNDAQSGDMINVAAGTYNENVNINKGVTLIGTGNPTVNSFILNSILGTGSGGITAPLVTVNQGAKILDGISLAALNGKVVVNPGKYADDLNQNFYESNIKLIGAPGVSVNSITLDKPLVEEISGKNFVNFDTLKTYVKSGGKIQDGVNLVSSGGTVSVGSGTFNENVVIDKSLTMSGAGTGASGTIVDGDGSCLTVDPGVFAYINNLKYSKGTGTAGSVPWITGGGGIFNRGVLTLVDCAITENTASLGGGIYNTGTIYMTGVSIGSNSAGSGGGIYNDHGTVNMYSGCSINGNNAVADGGGIYNDHGTVNMNPGSKINGNVAQSGPNLLLGGGGIYNDLGTVNMYYGSSIWENDAPYGGGIYNAGKVEMYYGSSIVSSKHGGGIENAPTGSLEFIDPSGIKIALKDESDPMLSWDYYANSNDYLNFFGRPGMAPNDPKNVIQEYSI